MSRISGATTASSASSQGKTKGNDLRDVDLDQFLRLMITELQHQDPLNPMDNSQLLQQITQIREIGATNQLSETLQSVLTGQTLATGGSLLGRRVEAIATDGTTVTGKVDRVTVEVDPHTEKRDLKVQIGDKSIDLKNVRKIIED